MAETPPPSGALADLLRLVGPYIPGIAGAVLGMAFGDKLTMRGKVVSLSAGMAAVLWVAPMLVVVAEHLWPLSGDLPFQAVACICFLTGTFGMVVLSGLAQAAAKYSRDPFGLVKFKAGGLTIGGASPEGETP